MDAFLVRLLLSFVTGGAWVMATTVAAEKLGPGLGGLLSGLPTTALVSIIFIGWSQNVEAAAQAAVMVPATMGLNTVFLLVYAALSSKGMVIAVFSALLVWVLSAMVLAALRLSDIFSSTLLFVTLASSSIILFERWVRVGTQKVPSLNLGAGQLLGRGIFAGIIIASAVYLTRVAGPWLGGLFSAFPATYLSIIVIFGRQHGSLIGGAMVRSMVVASTAISVFGVVTHLGLAALGLGPGIALGYACSLVVVIFLMVSMGRPRR
jgi:hypothetical protein